jgi:hypothetical protein
MLLLSVSEKLVVPSAPDDAGEAPPPAILLKFKLLLTPSIIKKPEVVGRG